MSLIGLQNTTGIVLGVSMGQMPALPLNLLRDDAQGMEAQSPESSHTQT